MNEHEENLDGTRDGVILYEPSDAERKFYDHGLWQPLKLLARTSGTKWFKERPTFKMFQFVGDHPIVQAWSEDIQNALMVVLDGYDWRSIFPIRVTAATDEEFEKLLSSKVVLLIGLAGDWDWSIAIKVAQTCRSVLVDAGIYNVEVELVEASVSRCASARTMLDPVLDNQYWAEDSQLNDAVHNLLQYAGTSFKSHGRDDSGTLGAVHSPRRRPVQDIRSHQPPRRYSEPVRGRFSVPLEHKFDAILDAPTH
jgi:hypothetical protein